MRITPTSYKIQIKIFKRAGCIYSHTKGDHIILHHPAAIRPVVIPKYKEVPVFVILNNMRIIGMSREEYFELLEKV